MPVRPCNADLAQVERVEIVSEERLEFAIRSKCAWSHRASLPAADARTASTEASLSCVLVVCPMSERV